jgi:hypothetical protein
MGYSLVAISMMILYALALIYREIFSKVPSHPLLLLSWQRDWRERLVSLVPPAWLIGMSCRVLLVPLEDKQWLVLPAPWHPSVGRGRGGRRCGWCAT